MYIYYVYAYLRNKDSANAKAGTPYYIGKGKELRAWTKCKGEVYPPSNLSNVVLLEQNLSNIGALALERRLIRIWGRLDISTGILRNKTDGGDGAFGRKHSPEAILKMSTAHKGKQFSKEHILNMSKSQQGHLTSILTRNKISKANKGHAVSDETKKKISIAKSGSNNPMFGKIPWNKGLKKHQLSCRDK